jgi:hypothetical protein
MLFSLNQTWITNMFGVTPGAIRRGGTTSSLLPTRTPAMVGVEKCMTLLLSGFTLW